ncbi:hypothetical protein DAI22_05g098001 [Oryza sativa Japonica Group]|nr:hypothetical protein DAI22_05g098001 [Oryza sativa Japonica Group]
MARLLGEATSDSCSREVPPPPLLPLECRLFLTLSLPLSRRRHHAPPPLSPPSPRATAAAASTSIAVGEASSHLRLAPRRRRAPLYELGGNMIGGRRWLLPQRRLHRLPYGGWGDASPHRMEHGEPPSAGARGAARRRPRPRPRPYRWRSVERGTRSLPGDWGGWEAQLRRWVRLVVCCCREQQGISGYPPILL